MADVYLADIDREAGIRQQCVVKLLHEELTTRPEIRQSLMDEARLVAQLRHTNIAGLYDIGRDGDDYFLVMEYVEGRDLHTVLARSVQRDQPLPLGFALHVASRLCAGLHFAHTRCDDDGTSLNLVHRDISPPNILISTVGEVKLIDFGVAKFTSSVRKKTRSGVIKGKFGYMSPEHAWDEDLDHRSDIFSVGVCLYEMLTGRSLYEQSDDAMTMLKRARSADIEHISDHRSVPGPVAQLIHQTLAKKREDRPPTAHALERQLQRLLANHQPGYTPLDTASVLSDLFDIEEPALSAVGDLSAPDMAPQNDPEEVIEPTAKVTVDKAALAGSYQGATHDMASPQFDAPSNSADDSQSSIARDRTEILSDFGDDSPSTEKPEAMSAPAPPPIDPSPEPQPEPDALKASSRDIFGDTEYDDDGVPILSADRQGSELARPNDIRRTGANPSINASEAQKGEEEGLDRRAQIGLAAIFVAIAFFVLLWRLI